MKAQVKWVGDNTFMGTSDSGHSMLMDANGGATAVSPMENVLLSLGGCSSVDVVSILEKARQQVTQCVVHLEGTRAESTPKVFTDIHLHFVITGHDVSAKHVERAVALSADKYCSVALMLNNTVNITHDFEIVGA
ncbi:OsmC family protein [Thalassotalea ponticola]|uniref:OsmC family protein n=1 Tax=Thalassotalea ponticola TaxID=1523392 RepID=UPI0025B35E8E|nr:OsmC family protein [Thalassotalea ponticola]MDN3653686.1 OsmC family protein [Thalassotalea ponticola]